MAVLLCHSLHDLPQRISADVLIGILSDASSGLNTYIDLHQDPSVAFWI